MYNYFIIEECSICVTCFTTIFSQNIIQSVTIKLQCDSIYMNLFSVFHLGTSSTFLYANYMVDILLRRSKLLLE